MFLFFYEYDSFQNKIQVLQEQNTSSPNTG